MSDNKTLTEAQIVELHKERALIETHIDAPQLHEQLKKCISDLTRLSMSLGKEIEDMRARLNQMQINFEVKRNGK